MIIFQLLAGEVELGPVQGIPGTGPLANPTNDPFGTLQKLLSGVIGFLTVGAILWFVLQIIFASYSWITSAGDPKAVGQAREKILFGAVGLIVVLGALVLVSLIGFLLGVPNILNIGELLGKLFE